MNSLIAEVMQRTNQTESNSSDKEQSLIGEKRKNDNEDSFHKRKKDQRVNEGLVPSQKKQKKKKVSSAEKEPRRKQVQAKSLLDKEEGKENSLGINKGPGGQPSSKKAKSSRKELEIAKANAANEATVQFFNLSGNVSSFTASETLPFSRTEHLNDSPLPSLSSPSNILSGNRPKPVLELQSVTTIYSRHHSLLSYPCLRRL